MELYNTIIFCDRLFWAPFLEKNFCRLLSPMRPKKHVWPCIWSIGDQYLFKIQKLG